VIVAVAGAVMINQYVDLNVANRLEKTVLTLDAEIAKQELLLNNVADLTKELGTDDITERILIGCQFDDRERFDQLLNLLAATISQPELKELDILFYKCGSYYADRKSLMAARLDREVVVYHEYQNLRTNLLSVTEPVADKIDQWKNLASMEIKLAEQFKTLVDLQGEIIQTLLAGKSRTSPEINATLEKVTAIRGEMAVRTQQIEAIRNSLRII